MRAGTSAGPLVLLLALMSVSSLKRDKLSTDGL